MHKWQIYIYCIYIIHGKSAGQTSFYTPAVATFVVRTHNITIHPSLYTLEHTHTHTHPLFILNPIPTPFHPHAHMSSTALSPPLRIIVNSSTPISPADTQLHLAAFLEGYKARANDTEGATGRGDMEGGLLQKLVHGLKQETSQTNLK